MRLHVVDGTFELYRAHFGGRPGHAGPSGQDLKATVGLASSMLALLQEAEQQVTHIAVAFDNPIASFRNDLFEFYKTDAGVPPELRNQFDAVEDACRALGIAVWSMDRFEADDALATAARAYPQAEQVVLLTPDKDLGQVLEGTRVVQIDRIRRKNITQASVEEKLGFGVQLIPDHLALVGDDADGIPGIPGIGQKSSSRLLATFGGLENIPQDPRKWPPGIRGADRLAATLADRQQDALLYRKLATLVTDVPLDAPLESLRWQGVPRKAFARWSEQVGLRTMLPAVHCWAD